MAPVFLFLALFMLLTHNVGLAVMFIIFALLFNDSGRRR